jgi:hypothetical protein
LTLTNSSLFFVTLLHIFIHSMPKMMMVLLPWVVRLVKIPVFELELSLLGLCHQVLLPEGLWRSLTWPGHSWVSSSSCVLHSLMT